MNHKKIGKIINETKEKNVIPNFVVLIFIVSLLVIDFFPYFKSMEIINPQFLYLSIVNLLIGIYFYFNSDHIAENTISILKKSYVLKIYAVFLFLCGLSFVVAKNTSLFLTRFTEILIVFCLFINLSILLKNKLNLLYNIVFIVCISAFFQSWQQLYHFLILPKNGSILEFLSTMKGNTGNINILAASLTIKVPFLLLGITHFHSLKKWFLVIALFTVTSIIFLTGARTALINLFLIYLVYTIYLLKEHSFNRACFTKILFLIIPVLIAILFANTIFEKSKDKLRFVSLEDRIATINSEDASANARLIYWGNALKLSQTSPALGIGLGNYQIESIPYERTTSNGYVVSLHAHNDFLEICAETGIVNSLIYLLLFIFIFVANVKKALKPNNSETKTIAILTLLLVIIYGIDSIFNFPMYRPTMQIFFSLLLALTLVNSSDLNNKLTAGASTSKILYPILITVAVVTSYSAFLIYKASNLEYLIKTDDIDMNQKGVLTGDEVIDRMPKYPNIFNTSQSFYEYAGIYYIREKNYEKALQCFSKASKINPYLGRINFYKNIICQQKGNTDSAYIYMKQAFYLRPRHLEIYKLATQSAGIRRDTLEILKEHKLFSKYQEIPEAWDIASQSLQMANFNHKSLTNFINLGLKKHPNDSILLKQRNNFVIAEFIMKGQNYVSQSKFDKALQTYNKALKLDPENIYVMQNIGFYYYNLNQPKQAIPFLLKALKYKGLEDGKTEFYLAVSYLNVNDKENACRYFNLSKEKGFANAQQQLNQNCK
jgi:O-antigen ligase/Tfp pilus assembly protein PilF